LSSRQLRVLNTSGDTVENIEINPSGSADPHFFFPAPLADADRDGVPDWADNCPNDDNPGQEDSEPDGGDGVGDVCDNCVDTPNPGQEDSEPDGGDGWGDVCDNCPGTTNPDQRDTNKNRPGGDVCAGDVINPSQQKVKVETIRTKVVEIAKEAISLETPIAEEGDIFHATTPFYRTRESGHGIIQFSAEAGFGAPRQPDIGHPEADDSRVIKLMPHSVSGPAASLNTSASLKQSTWQSTMSPDLFTGTGSPIRFHSATHANGFGVGYEIELGDIPPATDVEIVQVVELPAGLCLDDSEVTAGGGIGRLTIRDCTGGTPRVRISPTNFVAFGHQTVLEDTTSPNEFYGLQRLTEELDAQPLIASVGPADEVGSNFYNPSGATQTVEAPLVQTSYTLEENQADSANAGTTVSEVSCEGLPSDAVCYLVSMVVDAELIERNRETSVLILVGQAWSSLTPVDFGTGEVVYGRHIVSFDEEAVITGHDVTLELENTLGSPGSPPTFDGLPVDYSLLPNGGGTAAIENSLEQAQTGVGCSGGSWVWTGDSKIRFNGGGAGVGISSGGRVGPAHPCRASDPLDRDTNTGRCELDKVKRGSFSAEKLLIEGSMGALAGVESDIEIQELTFHQARDPNVTDEIALHAAGGVSCSADSGVRIGRNPSDGKILSNVPLDLNGCTEDEVGRGDCLPTPLSSPPGTGISNCKVRRMVLHGMASNNNPLGTELTVPTGAGVALASPAGRGEIGPKSYKQKTDRCEASLAGDPEASVIEGFEAMITVTGGPNVDDPTGASLEFDHPNAVPQKRYCLDKIRGDNNEVGLAVGANVDVRASRMRIEETQFSSVLVANGAANVETVDSTTACGSPCPSIDETTCQTIAQKLASPSSKKGGVNYKAVSALGKSARTKLSIKQSVLGLDKDGNPSSGRNPALPDAEIDENLVMKKTLTIAGRQANLGKPSIYIGKGADTICQPELLEVKLTGNNIGVGSPGVSVDNEDSPESETNLSLVGNFFQTADGVGSTGPLMGLAKLDSELQAVHTVWVEERALVANDAGEDTAADHKCYGTRAKGATSIDQDVMLFDPFFFPDEGGLSTTATVLQPFEFCNPVNKNGDGLPDSEAHLTCYDLSEDTPALPTVLVGTTAFEEDDIVALGGANRLCVPTIPTGVDLPLGDLQGRLNQFKCYERAKRAPKGTRAVVDLQDQFDPDETMSTTVKEGPFLVCNAVAVGIGGAIVEDPGVAQHLACFKIQDEDAQRKFSTISVSAEDQFGFPVLDLNKSKLLCVPATVVPEASL